MAKIPKKYFSILLDFYEITFIGVAVFILVYLFICQPIIVEGDSMYPNLENNEQVLTDKLTLKYSEPKRGDVLIIKSPTEPNKILVKRLIGLPREEFMISNGKVLINGVLLEEQYLSESTQTNEQKTIKENSLFSIPDNNYLFLGDNREKSLDSRTWGTISKDMIVGKAFFVYYPFNSFRRIK